MKVKISFTLDVDLDAWKTEYHLSTAQEVREDVQRYVENGIKDHLREQGLLTEGA